MQNNPAYTYAVEAPIVPGLANEQYYRLMQCVKAKSQDQTFKGQSFYGKCVYVTDGDTVHIAFFVRPQDVDSVQYVCRLSGLDTPELRPKKTDPNRDRIKAKAQAAKQYVKDRVEDKVVYFRCVETKKDDPYRRLLIVLWYFNGYSWINLNEELITTGHAQPYDGGTKPVWK